MTILGSRWAVNSICELRRAHFTVRMHYWSIFAVILRNGRARLRLLCFLEILLVQIVQGKLFKDLTFSQFAFFCLSAVLSSIIILPWSALLMFFFNFLLVALELLDDYLFWLFGFGGGRQLVIGKIQEVLIIVELQVECFHIVHFVENDWHW